MRDLIFIKLGGSLITDKRGRYQVRRETLARLAGEIAAARRARPGLQLLLAHGSGSFGHVAARESGYDPESGHPTPLALAQVGAAAAALNQHARQAMVDAGVPVLSLPPSASARLHDGQVIEMDHGAFERLLARDLVPLTFGDVALFAEHPGGAIASTEALFGYLAPRLAPTRVLLLGIEAGVYARPPVPGAPPPPLLEEITPDLWRTVRTGVGGSHGTDVTGGMSAKVEEALALAARLPTTSLRIASGDHPGVLKSLLLDPTFAAGTLIHAPHSTP